MLSRSRSQSQHFSVLATPANGNERPLQFELRKVQHTLSRGWPRNMCAIEHHQEPWRVSTELATLATFLRITPLADCPPVSIARGFTTQHPPPVPSELVCFRAEWQVQNALEAMDLPDKGFLSAAAWERDISYLFDAATYEWYDEHLHKLLLASEPPAEARVERVNLLVKQAASMEMFEMGEDPTTEHGHNLLEDIMLGWQRVIHLLAERFAVSEHQIRFCSLLPRLTQSSVHSNLTQVSIMPSLATSSSYTSPTGGSCFFFLHLLSRCAPAFSDASRDVSWPISHATLRRNACAASCRKIRGLHSRRRLSLPSLPSLPR